MRDRGLEEGGKKNLIFLLFLRKTCCEPLLESTYHQLSKVAVLSVQNILWRAEDLILMQNE